MRAARLTEQRPPEQEREIRDTEMVPRDLNEIDPCAEDRISVARHTPGSPRILPLDLRDDLLNVVQLMPGRRPLLCGLYRYGWS